MAERMFTPAEANAALPLVKRIVADILEHGREIKELGPRLEEDDVAYRRAVELGLRSKGAAELIREYVAELDPFRVECGLAWPAPDSLGLDLPAGVLAARQEA